MSLADGAVWGRLTEIKEGDVDRLLVISVEEFVAGAAQRGPHRMQLLERAGQLPDRTPLVPGDTGLYLYTAAHETSHDFDQDEVDGGLVSGGFFESPTALRDGRAVRSLVRGKLDGESPTTLKDLTFALLRSDDTWCRALATDWLTRESVSLGSDDESALGQIFDAEGDDRLLERQLNLLLIRDLPVAGPTLPNLILDYDDPVLNDLTLRYLGRHGDVNDFALLLRAYPFADHSRKQRLLVAYARLEMNEAEAWWLDAIESNDPQLVDCALEWLGRSRLPRAANIYRDVLESRSPAVRKRALAGLASLATPRATKILRDYRDDEDVSERERRFVDEILRHPFRHAPRRERAVDRRRR